MGTDRRADLEAAFAKADEAASSEPEAISEPAPIEAVEAAPEAEVTETESAAAQRARDEGGRYAKAPKESKKPAPSRAGQGKADGIGDPPPVPSATPVPVPGATTQTPVPVPGVADQTRPPQSWKPAVREKWATLPSDVQAEITRLENDAKGTLREAAEARKKWASIEQAAQPYEAMIRGQGGDPARGYASYLQTYATLTHGAPTDKAQMVAQMITKFLPGEEGVRLLASALDGTSPPQGHGQSQYLTPAQAQQMMQQQWQQMIAQGAEAQARKQWETFAAARPHLQDERLGPQLESLMKTARATGIAADDDSAYRWAINSHPELGAAERQKEAAKAAANANASTQRSLDAAASSIKSQPAPTVVNGAPKSRRAAIEAAIKQHGGNR